MGKEVPIDVKANLQIEEMAIGEDLKDTLPDDILPDEEGEVDDGEGKASEEANESEDADISESLIEEMHNAFNYWHTHGYPEKASVLWECIQQRRRPPANLLPSNLTGINPETTIDPSSLEVPPREGRNATHLIWREFAKKVIDMEPEIVDTLDRKDIIGILEDKGVIEKKGPSED